jgi:hypothetical protein
MSSLREEASMEILTHTGGETLSGLDARCLSRGTRVPASQRKGSHQTRGGSTSEDSCV